MALHGRRDIYTSASAITEANVLEELNTALCLHTLNAADEDYLYRYRRGEQPILLRKKEVREDICNKVVENHAEEIVTFKNGYFLQKPAFYIARNAEASDRVGILNEYLYRSGKQAADNKLVDGFHTMGKAVLYVAPIDDDYCPVKCYYLDPRFAFVVYSTAPGHPPMMGVHISIVDEKVIFDVFTQTQVFRISGSAAQDVLLGTMSAATAEQVLEVLPNQLPGIPIIEYRYGSTGMSAFESVIGLLDAINTVQSNRLDGVEQFIQSILIAVNADFDEGTTSADIRKAGMIQLNSTSEHPADFRQLSDELDQTQTQTLVDYLYEQVLTICGMPGATRKGASTSDTGSAVLARSGWAQADTFARNTEDLFRESNEYFDKLFCFILAKRGILNISRGDFCLEFSHGEMTNVQSKAQSFYTLLSAGMAPELAMSKSGISNDPTADMEMSKKYLRLRWGDPDAPVTDTGKKGGVDGNLLTSV